MVADHGIGHLALNTDDVDATVAFYENVFGWSFEAWGPPGFHRTPLPGGMILAVQPRRELVPGQPTVGAEATVTVDDLDGCLTRVRDAGGRILMQPTEIPGVGTVAFAEDPGGNPVGPIQLRR